MTGVAALCLTLAVLVAWPRAAGWRLRVRVDTVRVARGRMLPGLLLLVVSVAVLALAASLGGLRAVVVGGCVVALAGTAAMLIRAGWQAHRQRLRRDQVACFCEAWVTELRLGATLGAALASAAESVPSLRRVAEASAVGLDVGPVLTSLAAEPGFEALAGLGRAWTVAERSGAALAPVLLDVQAALRAARESERQVATELASARATSRLLGLLPLAGLGLGYAFGGNPLDYLTSSTAGLIGLALGILLTCAGLLWSDALARKAGGR
ncbi:MAG TPA: hypothetical protein DEG88_00010 [Propionibacteriaceae bacterium]|nr:type II secretion system F family protein [Micropruina sp.]HBX83034.1 hypothetical protein [Propionibacteriaceae bacterium]HBY21724.1 hypothetical protein [Propionibacteriaceae bacterium]